MKAFVFFQKYDESGNTSAKAGYEFKAIVECGDRTWEDALEWAYHRTQNIHGSWSRHEYEAVGSCDNFNPDYHPDVMPTDLEEIDGVVYGHRSSMPGDRFIVDGQAYEVADFGFKQVEWPERFTKTGNLAKEVA